MIRRAGTRRRAAGSARGGYHAALLLLIALASPVRAQSSASGIIAGTVRQSSGAPIAVAVVTARRADGSYERRGTTDGTGGFRLAALPPGTYDVTARRLGYRPVIMRGVMVSAATVSTITITLEPSARTLAPVVVSQPAAPPGAETEVSPLRIDAREIAQLPVGLDLDRLVALTPGVRPDQMWGGAGFQANAYRLDGVPIDHPGIGGAIVQPSVHWIQELDVRGLGAAADEGGFQGGLVDVVTKSGSNTRKGSISADYENDALDATNLSGTDIVPELADRREVAAEQSGPIVRNRLFYFVAGQWVRTAERALDHLGTARYSPVPLVTDAPSGFGKLTWTPTLHDLVNLGVALSDSVTDHAGLTGRETADATLRVRAPSAIVDASWQHTIGAATILEARFVSFSAAMHADPYAGPNVPGVATYQLGTSRSYQNAPFTVTQRPTSAGYTLTVDHFAHWLGDHHFRAGIEQVFGGWHDDRTRNSGMTWRPRYSSIDGTDSTFVPTDASTWQTWTPTSWGGETHVHAHVQNGAVFLQDDFTHGRLGLHPGVRFGWWSGTIDPVGGGPTIHALSTHAFDPRVGLTLNVGTTGKPAQLTVHWGRYHQDLFAEMFDRVQGANAYSNYQVWEYGGPAFTDPARVITQAQRDSMAAIGQFRLLEFDQLDQSGPVSNYHQPYLDQFVVGLQAEPTPHLHLAATFVARDNRDIIALVDRNLATDYVEMDSVTVADHFGGLLANYNGDTLIIPRLYVPKNAIIAALQGGYTFPVTLPPGQTLTYNPDYVITNPPGAKRQLRQVLLEADARYPTWEASASLALTSLRGNFSTVSGYDPNSVTGRDQLIGRGPGPYVRLNEQTNFNGELDNASHIEFKLRAVHDLPARFRGGLVVSTVSGDRLTPSFTIEPYTYSYTAYGDRPMTGNPNDPQPQPLPGILFVDMAGERINLAPLGSYHYAGHMIVDVHLERPVETGGVHWTLTIDAFNVLGSKAVTLVNTSLDASSDPNSLTQFASPLGRVPPRTLRLGTSAAW